MKKLTKTSFYNKFMEVIVINKDNSQTKMKFIDAINESFNQGLDLVQVNDNSKSGPIICKYIDYGKHLYDSQKKEKEAKAKQKEIIIKEVQFTPTIAENDLSVKINKIINFLNDGCKVRTSIDFKGRMAAKKQLGDKVLEKILQIPNAIVEKQIVSDKSIQIILSRK